VARAQTGDVSIEYEVHGDSGDWLLLVQGLGYARWGWAWQVEDLARAFRVITFDNRGVGGSDAPPGPYTVEQMAGDAVGLLDALGVERAHVVGASLGGLIAQEIAIGRPERVARLVLACTTFGGPQCFPMPEQTVSLIQRAAEMSADERLRAFVENALSPSFVASRPDVVERIMQYRVTTAQPLAAWQAQAAAGAAFDSSERLGGVKAQALVVTGTEDVVVDPRNSKLLAGAVPGASLVEMSGGHLFFVEYPERFNALVEGFVNAVTKGGER